MGNDRSSDTGLKKMSAVAVNIFDANQSKKVACKFYEICVTTGANSGKLENIFSGIDLTVKNNGANWYNLVRFGVANSTMGIRNY